VSLLLGVAALAPAVRGDATAPAPLVCWLHPVDTG
jgi:hypothetical protein